MRATVIYGAGGVRVEDVPDAAVRDSTDAAGRRHLVVLPVGDDSVPGYGRPPGLKVIIQP
jgi:hypothetical protein